MYLKEFFYFRDTSSCLLGVITCSKSESSRFHITIHLHSFLHISCQQKFSISKETAQLFFCYLHLRKNEFKIVKVYSIDFSPLATLKQIKKIKTERKYDVSLSLSLLLAEEHHFESCNNKLTPQLLIDVTTMILSFGKLPIVEKA
ncbi:hypothetical protein T4D_4998 [Trichinella pseudospiralis]|uniref:Uncharacterized protein n=1 Tax=Trichinella pseudospiralis TaxID=6337 RepID=A0A0V1FP08_TRIPS|nr:hypothetical protein T4D_4998 [Trichinella pseudospiralis]